MSGGTEKRGIEKGIPHIMRSLMDMPAGSHTLLVYPDLMTLRQVYARYLSMNSHNKSELLVILPYYETVESVKNNLMNDDASLNKYTEMVKEGSLIIRDCHDILHGYEESIGNFSNENDSETEKLNTFMMEILFHAKKIGKKVVSVWVDTGAFHTDKMDSRSLIDYEKRIQPEIRSATIKQFCLYHQLDFELRLDRNIERQILDYHDKKILLLDNV